MSSQDKKEAQEILDYEQSARGYMDALLAVTGLPAHTASLLADLDSAMKARCTLAEEIYQVVNGEIPSNIGRDPHSVYQEWLQEDERVRECERRVILPMIAVLCRKITIYHG